jgi:hypothetical protein
MFVLHCWLICRTFFLRCIFWIFFRPVLPPTTVSLLLELHPILPTILSYTHPLLFGGCRMVISPDDSCHKLAIESDAYKKHVPKMELGVCMGPDEFIVPRRPGLLITSTVPYDWKPKPVVSRPVAPPSYHPFDPSDTAIIPFLPNVVIQPQQLTSPMAHPLTDSSNPPVPGHPFLPSPPPINLTHTQHPPGLPVPSPPIHNLAHTLHPPGIPIISSPSLSSVSSLPTPLMLTPSRSITPIPSALPSPGITSVSSHPTQLMHISSRSITPLPSALPSPGITTPLHDHSLNPLSFSPMVLFASISPSPLPHHPPPLLQYASDNLISP